MAQSRQCAGELSHCVGGIAEARRAAAFGDRGTVEFNPNTEIREFRFDI